MRETKQECKNKFSQRLFGAASTRKSHNPERHFRRLDSLARLLEGNSICAAVYFNTLDNSLWVASNKVHAASRTSNAHIDNIKHTFELITDERVSNEEALSQLSKSIYDNFTQENRWLLTSLEKAKIDLLATIKAWLKDFSDSGEPSKTWLKNFIDQLECDASIRKALEKCAAKIARLARDFLKLRNFLRSSNLQSSLSGNIAKALREKKYQILHFDNKDVHAEMRILGKILKTPGAEKSYVGISKLCCAHCALAVAAFETSTRGLHGQAVDWPLPECVKDNLKTYLGKESYALYAQQTADNQKEILTYATTKKNSPIKGSKNRNMNADWSDSDEETLSADELVGKFKQLSM